MNTVMAFLSQVLGRLHHDEEGQALVEYALILALIAVVVIAALHFLGGDVGNTLNNVGNQVGG